MVSPRHAGSRRQTRRRPEGRGGYSIYICLDRSTRMKRRLRSVQRCSRVTERWSGAKSGRIVGDESGFGSSVKVSSPFHFFFFRPKAYLSGHAVGGGLLQTGVVVFSPSAASGSIRFLNLLSVRDPVLTFPKILTTGEFKVVFSFVVGWRNSVFILFTLFLNDERISSGVNVFYILCFVTYPSIFSSKIFINLRISPSGLIN